MATGGSFGGAKAVSGTASTGALSSNTTYSITCNGTGGTSAPATQTVTITSGTVTVSPRATGVTQFQQQQFTATVPGGGTPAWSVDGHVGGNATVGVIDSTGLYTPGTALGAHTILASSGSASGVATVGVTDLAGVTTYHNNLSRDGANVHEYALNTSNVSAGSFGRLAACAVDGAIYAQPLWMPNLTVNGAKHNVVFVATQHDTLYAFDADASSCTQLWKAILVDTAHGGATGEVSVPSNLVGSSDIAPEIGVTSTPVIDPVNGIIYVLAKSVTPPMASPADFHQRLHAIDVASGNEKAGSPAPITATFSSSIGTGNVTFDPQKQGQRPGLALVNGVVYVAWASHGDLAPFFGWMMGYRYTAASGAPAGFTQTAVFNAAPNATGGVGGAGIWMTGNAPAADANGNLYVVTGNGPFDANSVAFPNPDYGDSLIKLNPSLTVSDYYTPPDQAADNASDLDFGSGGVGVLADLAPNGSYPRHLLICGGKSGNIYVVNRDSLGGYDAPTLPSPVAVQSVSVSPSTPGLFGLYASGALWNNYFYVSAVGANMAAYSLSPIASSAPLSPTATSVTSTQYMEGGGTPSVSSATLNGNLVNGILWALDNANYCTTQAPGCGPTVLHAYDANNLATELWNSGGTAGNAVKFSIPTIANGKVYVGTRGADNGSTAASPPAGELDIYGLLP